ncbi:Transposon TX1 uncharacterized 149 kDa protein [Linum grandiflorum]
MSRLDRIAINLEWETKFPDCTVKVLSRVCSDHNPLILEAGQIVTIRRPWRFENLWLEHDGFSIFLQEVWRERVEGFGGMFLLATRLKVLKEKLKDWNREVFKWNETEIVRCLGVIAELDNQEESRLWTEAQRINRCMLKFELDKLWKRQEMSWRQKSRKINLRLGDRNTIFFHRMACHNKRRNSVNSLRVDGVMYEGQVSLAHAIVGFYERLYSEDLMVRPFSSELIRGTISEAEGFALTRPFSIEEVERVVMNCVGDKTPGPDGFTLEFYKRNWKVIKEQVILAFSDFHHRATLPDMVNCNFVCLIPKRESVEDVKDFLPISLTSSIYKILSKILMERLRNLMPALVSKH